jgi:hypothetical protein
MNVLPAFGLQPLRMTHLPVGLLLTATDRNQ